MTMVFPDTYQALPLCWAHLGTEGHRNRDEVVLWVQKFFLIIQLTPPLSSLLILTFVIRSLCTKWTWLYLEMFLGKFQPLTNSLPSTCVIVAIRNQKLLKDYKKSAVRGQSSLWWVLILTLIFYHFKTSLEIF